MNPQPTLIPLQLPQSIPLTPSTPASGPPNAIKIEPSATVVPSVYTPTYTPTNQTARNIAVAQTFNPPKFEGLIQPHGLKLPQMNGGTHPSEAGPIRHRQSRPASERPSPVALDGEESSTEYLSCSNVIAYTETQEALRKAIPRYAKIDQRPPFTYASLIRQVCQLVTMVALL